MKVFVDLNDQLLNSFLVVILGKSDDIKESLAQGVIGQIF